MGIELDEEKSLFFTNFIKPYLSTGWSITVEIHRVTGHGRFYCEGYYDEGEIGVAVGPGCKDQAIYMALAHEMGHLEQEQGVSLKKKDPLPVPLTTPLIEVDAWRRGLKYARDWKVVGEYVDYFRRTFPKEILE